MMRRFYHQAKENFYYVKLDTVTLTKTVENPIDPTIRLFVHYMGVNDASHPDPDERRGVLSHCGEFAQKACFSSGDQSCVADAFVTHAWLDDAILPGAKFKAMMEFTTAFKNEHGRLPRIWFEKFCIKQDEDVMVAVKLLPCYISCCSSMLCLFSERWVKRLWCQTEAATLSALCDTRKSTVNNMIIYPLDPDQRASSVKVPRSRAASCGAKEDETALRRSIRRFPGGEPLFRHWVSLALGQKSRRYSRLWVVASVVLSFFIIMGFISIPFALRGFEGKCWAVYTGKCEMSQLSDIEPLDLTAFIVLHVV